jgi:hypothetical protein
VLLDEGASHSFFFFFLHIKLHLKAHPTVSCFKINMFILLVLRSETC